MRISYNKEYPIDTLELRFNDLYKGKIARSTPGFVGNYATTTAWLNSKVLRGGDTTYISSGSKLFASNYEGWMQYFYIGDPATQSKAKFRLGFGSMFGTSGGLYIYSSDSLVLRRKNHLLFQGDFVNQGYLLPYDLQSDSIRLYFRGRGTGRVLTGKDPFLLLRQPITGGIGTRPVGSMELNVTGKLMWPWATSEFEEFVLCRGIMAMPAGSSLATNKFIRVGGELHSPVQPIRWANRPFTLVYPKGNDYGVWGADIDWRQTPEFRAYVQDPTSQVVLDNFQPDRPGEGSNFVTLDTSMVARNVTFKNALLTRPYDTLTVARNQGGWIQEGVLKLDASLPAVVGNPAAAKGLVALGRNDIPIQLTINSQTQATQPLYLQAFPVKGTLQTGASPDTFGIRIIGPADAVLTNYRAERKQWQTMPANQPSTVRRDDFGFFQSHTPEGPWRRVGRLTYNGNPYHTTVP